MKKVTAKITGRVCDVGYRNIVDDAAYQNNINGYVKYIDFRPDGCVPEKGDPESGIKKQSETKSSHYDENAENNPEKQHNKIPANNSYPHAVEVIAEGEESDLKKFFEEIKVRKRPVYVEKISQIWEESEGEYSYFELVREDFCYELYEGFNKIAIMDEKMDFGWLRYKRLIEEESDLTSDQPDRRA
jgi:acylphosphatase